MLTPTLRLPNTTNAVGPTRIDDRWGLLHGLDDSLRVNSPLGTAASDYEDFYEIGQGIDVQQCWRPIYVQISFGSWDMHQNIYSPAANSLAAMDKQLDNGVSALLGDLKASGQLDSTPQSGKDDSCGRERPLPAAVGDLRPGGGARRPAVGRRTRPAPISTATAGPEAGTLSRKTSK